MLKHVSAEALTLERMLPSRTNTSQSAEISTLFMVKLDTGF